MPTKTLANSGLGGPFPLNSTEKSLPTIFPKKLTHVLNKKRRTRSFICKVNHNFLRCSRHFHCDRSFRVIVSVVNLELVHQHMPDPYTKFHFWIHKCPHSFKFTRGGSKFCIGRFSMQKSPFLDSGGLPPFTKFRTHPYSAPPCVYYLCSL